MEKLFKAENPVWLTITIGLFVLALALILSPSAGAKLLDLVFYNKRRKQKKELTDKFFLSHPIHDYLVYNIERLKTLSFGDDAKTALIKDMFYLFFTIYHEKLKEFISVGINTTDKYEFKKLVRDKILTADSAIETAWLGLGAAGIVSIVKEINAWQSQSTSFTRMAIYSITDSEIFDNPQERMQEILVVLETRFRVTLPDIERGLVKDNSIFDGLEYTPIYLAGK
jgi:hypothetical protein